MNLNPISLSAALAIICTFTPSHAEKAGDDNANSDPSPSSTAHGIATPTHARSMDDAVREWMESFSHALHAHDMASLHDSFIRHPPFAAHPRFHGERGEVADNSRVKPFSTWGSLAMWSPRYEVIDDAETFRFRMDVPGFRFHEMKVELESGGRVLSVFGAKESERVRETSEDEGGEGKAVMGEKANEEPEGKEEEERGGRRDKLEYRSHSLSSFRQKFTLDPSVDTSLMTANLADGVLEVRAPRKHGAWNGRHIPITQFDEGTWAELMAAEDKLNETTEAIGQQK